MVYRILIILGLLFHAQSYADAWYEGSHGGSFYSGDLASRQSESTQSFIQAPPQKYKSGSSAPFFADATVPSFEGGQAKVTKQITKYYLFPMQMQKGQHAVFTGKLEGSNKIVTLKDMELVNKMVNQQLPIINGTMHLIVGKKVVMVLTFKGNTMRIKELPDDLLPTQQICESEACCLKVNLSRQTPGTEHSFYVNLINGVCPVEQAYPKAYLKNGTIKGEKHPAHAKPKKKNARKKKQVLTVQPTNPLEEYEQAQYTTAAYKPTNKKDFWKNLG